MTVSSASSPTKEDDNRVRGTAHKLARELGLLHAVDDLIGYGYQGMVEARRSYDPSRGVPFGPFAYYRIRGAILDGAQRVAGLSRRTHARILAAINEMLHDAADVRAHAGEAPDMEEVGLGLDDVVGKMMSALVTVDAAEQQKTPEAQLDEEMHRLRVRRAMSALPEREQRVVKAFYFEERRFEDVGADLGISAATACRAHARALAMLRESLGSPSG